MSRWDMTDRQRRGRIVLTASLVCFALGASSPAWAQGADETVDAQEAEAEFQRLVKSATEKYGNKDYVGAAEDFKRAYEVQNKPNILYNIGRIYEKAGKFEEAITFYDRFVNEPDVEIENRKDALNRLQTLREIVELRRKEAEEREKKVAPPPEPDYTLSYVFLGVGSGALVGSGVFALLAGSAHSDFESATTKAGIDEAAQQGRTRAIVADALLATGVVSAALGVIFYATASPEAPAEETQAIWAPQIGPDRVGIGMTVNF